MHLRLIVNLPRDLRVGGLLLRTAAVLSQRLARKDQKFLFLLHYRGGILRFGLGVHGFAITGVSRAQGGFFFLSHRTSGSKLIIRETAAAATTAAAAATAATTAVIIARLPIG
jgi:hypothetical protein